MNTFVSEFTFSYTLPQRPLDDTCEALELSTGSGTQ